MPLDTYLSCRKQYVRFKQHLHNASMCNLGVPQGGMLSALLFIIYVSNIVECTGINGNLVKY